MDIATLKKSLISKIQATNNNDLLEEILRFLNGQDEENTQVYQLNDEQKNAIAEAGEDITNGNYSTNDQVNDEFKKWLEK